MHRNLQPAGRGRHPGHRPRPAGPPRGDAAGQPRRRPARRGSSAPTRCGRRWPASRRSGVDTPRARCRTARARTLRGGAGEPCCSSATSTPATAAASTGDDRRRPVSPNGSAPGGRARRAYADHRIAAIVTSPVHPVRPERRAARGRRRRRPSRRSTTWPRARPLDVVDRLLRTQAQRAKGAEAAIVVCTHGDVIGDVVQHLARPRGRPRRAGERRAGQKGGDLGARGRRSTTRR